MTRPPATGRGLDTPRTRLDLDRIRAACEVIDPVFLASPLYPCDALGARLGCTVSIKLETANPVRSFKGRGTELVAHWDPLESTCRHASLSIL